MCQQNWFLLKPPPWLADSCLLSVSSHGLLSVTVHPWVSLSIVLRALVSLILMTLFYLNCLLKASSPNVVTLEVRASVYEFGGDSSVRNIFLGYCE